jgi:hypothetical protein
MVEKVELDPMVMRILNLRDSVKPTINYKTKKKKLKSIVT